MDEMEFTEAESNMNDLISEYQQYQGELICHIKQLHTSHPNIYKLLFCFQRPPLMMWASMRLVLFTRFIHFKFYYSDIFRLKRRLRMQSKATTKRVTNLISFYFLLN